MKIFDLQMSNLNSFLELNPVSLIAFLVGEETDSEQIYERMTEAARSCRMKIGFGIVSTVDPTNIPLCRIHGVGMTPMVKYFVNGTSAGINRLGVAEIMHGLTDQMLDRDFMSLARSSERNNFLRFG